jgi:hypothetical protein
MLRDQAEMVARLLREAGMGIEYSIRAADGRWEMSEPETRNFLQELISRKHLPGIASWRDGGFEFRAQADDSRMPDITIQVESDGLTVCAYGGDRPFAAEVLGRLAAALTHRFPEPGVTITEL